MEDKNFLVSRKRKIQGIQKCARLSCESYRVIEDRVRHSWKKGLLQLIFKCINIKDGKINDFELFEPFKNLYEGMEIKCQVKQTKEVLTIPESVSTSARSDDK